MGTWPIEAWMRKSGVLLTKRSLALMVKRELHLLQKRMVPWVVGTTLKRSITESTTRSIATNIIRDQMSLSEEWTRKSMVSLLTLFPHLTPLSEALLHSCQMVLMNLLSRVLHSTREDTTATRDQMSLSEEWTRKSMVSLLTPFHHSTPELEALCHSFQTAQTHLPTMVSLSLQRDQMLPKEEWMRRFTVSLLTPFHHSTPESEAPCHSFQTVLIHLPTMVSLPSLERETLLRETPTGMFTVSFMTKFQLLTLGRDTHMVTFQMDLTHLLSKVLLPSLERETLLSEEW